MIEVVMGLVGIIACILAFNQQRKPNQLGWDCWNWPAPDKQRLVKVTKIVGPVLLLLWISLVLGESLPYNKVIAALLNLILFAMSFQRQR